MICLVSGAQPILARYAHTGSYGQLIVPRSGDVPDMGLPWACDNGGYHGVDVRSFARMLDKCSGYGGCLWVTAPDVLGDAPATLENYERWEPVLREAGWPVALVGQDGLQPGDVPWHRVDCFFIGGSLEWKRSAAVRSLIAAAQARRKRVHAGRCGTLQRIRYFQSLGVDTCDSAIFSRHARPAFEAFTGPLTYPQMGLGV